MAESQFNSSSTEGLKAETKITPTNIILNHDFSESMRFWRANCCNVNPCRRHRSCFHAFVASEETGLHYLVTANSGLNYAVATKRTQFWQGIEQDITERIRVGTIYTVTASVRVCGDHVGPSEVIATFKLEYSNSPTTYTHIRKIVASKDQWETLEGTFLLSNMPNRVIFFMEGPYMEGPLSSADLLIDSVSVSTINPTHFVREINASSFNGDENIILNPCFEDGLSNWSCRGCKLVLHNSLGDRGIFPIDGNSFAAAIERSHSWSGIEQDITDRVHRKMAYEVTAVVRIIGNASSAEVRATLYLKAPNGREEYIWTAQTRAMNQNWVQLRGRFLVQGNFVKAVIFIEGPTRGIDVLVDSLVVTCGKKSLRPLPPNTEGLADTEHDSPNVLNINIISNHEFSKGLHCWYLNRCDGYVVSVESEAFNGVKALTGSNYVVITNRTQSWQALEQDLTSKVSYGSTYSVSAYVRLTRAHSEPATVTASFKIEYSYSPTRFFSVGSALVSSKRWEKLEGFFTLENMAERVVFCLEGPPDIDLLIDSANVSCISLRPRVHVQFGVNIIENYNLTDGLNHWSPFGSCTLRVCTGSPILLPSMAARGYTVEHHSLSGHYILTTDREDSWMGPAQTITDKLQLHVTYQVSAWVRVGPRSSGSQVVCVSFGLDDQTINRAQVEVDTNGWHEIGGSFRLEKEPSKVVVYVHGPSPGVDLMVGGLNIFPVNKKARFKHLKEKTDKVRKGDIILKFRRTDNVHVKVRQIKNSFPFGSCISRPDMENEELVDFFVKNFNWAAMRNEFNWDYTEPEQGKHNYEAADEMLEFFKKYGISVRGHSIFCDQDDKIQPWVRSLSGKNLFSAVEKRLNSLLSRYKDKFKHYDVINEILHGSFYRDKLGGYIGSSMFKEAHRIDPATVLFVNDYNVETGSYIRKILDLEEQGSPVGGVGLHGCINYPVGVVIGTSLDKLAVLGRPIWFTELSVAEANENARADDLEVVLREAFAHPAVEGIVLSGFWELAMRREDSHLVDADGGVNEAGRRFMELKEEWLSHAEGLVDAHGQFKFRGFYGTYSVEIISPLKKLTETFVVDKGDGPFVLNLNL